MTLSFNGKQLNLSSPRVMGILNLAPDSFFDGGKYHTLDARLKRVEKMLNDGASIIDLGAVSTRPGAKAICADEELERLIPAFRAIRTHFSDCFLSVDTFHPSVARKVVELGADMINDIYGGRFHEEMLNTIAGLGVPYILMHMKGTPATMQQNPVYQDVVAEIAYFFQQQTGKLRELKAGQVLIDPGFGFGKTVDHNFEILSRLREFENLGHPLVVGLSRKSMIQQAIGINVLEALNGSTVLHTIALLNGATILRVHDVKEAVQAVKLVSLVNRDRI